MKIRFISVELIGSGSTRWSVLPSAVGSRMPKWVQEPFDDYNEQVDAALKKMVWSHPGVSSWYKNKKGRVIMNSPWRLVDYWAWTRTPDPDDFVFG